MNSARTEWKWINVAAPADEPDWRRALVWRAREGNGWRERILCVLPAKEEVIV